MRRMEFGVWLQANRPVRELAEDVRLAEDVGLDFVGITDGQLIWRDVYVALTAAALNTKRIMIGPWVTNAITRHVTVTASAICSIDEISEGRAFLGIGVGGDSVEMIRHPLSTPGELGEAVNVIRSLSRGEVAHSGENEWRLATARPNGIRIYWAGAGRRSLTAGGSFADGVIDSNWLVPSMLEEAVASIDAGARQASRNPSDVAKIFNSALSLGADRSAALEIAKPYVASGLTYKRSEQVPGWSADQRKALVAEYNWYEHFSQEQRTSSLVPDDLVQKKAIAGTPEDAVELLQMVVAAGYSKIGLVVFGDVRANIRLFGEQVVPKLQTGEVPSTREAR